MQKTIYIANPELWAEIVLQSGEKSISRYLVDLHTDNVQRQKDDHARQAEIQEQIELVDALPPWV